MHCLLLRDLHEAGMKQVSTNMQQECMHSNADAGIPALYSFTLPHNLANIELHLEE